MQNNSVFEFPGGREPGPDPIPEPIAVDGHKKCIKVKNKKGEVLLISTYQCLDQMFTGMEYTLCE